MRRRQNNTNAKPMKTRLIKIIFTIPFLFLDGIVLPIYLIYWIVSGKLLTPLTQQLWEAE
jgi:hypothetical protein